jgi:hypothetical protein
MSYDFAVFDLPEQPQSLPQFGLVENERERR